MEETDTLFSKIDRLTDRHPWLMIFAAPVIVIIVALMILIMIGLAAFALYAPVPVVYGASGVIAAGTIGYLIKYGGRS